MSPASTRDNATSRDTAGEAPTIGSGGPFDPAWFRRVLGQYPTGVCVVTAKDVSGSPIGMAIGSFNSVSLDPPLVAFFPVRGSGTWRRIAQAGSFCVNVLGADQEHICRRFAAPGEDRFVGIGSREASSGSPILEGVVAWIDCDIEFVHEAGDHDIVVGLVRELDIENVSLPLLFYQGGYGRFAPHSLAAGNTAGVLTEQLRWVDLARPEMERIGADIPHARCTAITMQDDDLVITATAGDPEAGVTGSLVGQRIALLPPLGAPFIAWMDEASIGSWLSHLPEDSDREHARARLVALRDRGFSVSTRTEELTAFTSALDQRASAPDTIDDEALRERIRRLAHDPVELTDDVKKLLGSVTVPVFSAENQVAMLLTVHGFPPPASITEADEWIECVRAAAARATESLSRYAHPARPS